MDAQYAAAMPPMAAFYPGGHPPIMPPPPPDLFQTRLHQLHTFPLEPIGPYPELPDSAQSMNPPQQQGSQRARRRQLAGGEHVKHRRTRSGCYTCRQRRVKCDEKRPICDRCRKGKRDCAYPETSSSSSRASRRESQAKGTSGESGSSPSGDDEEGDDRKELPSIPDEEEDLDFDDDEPPSATSDVQIDTVAAIASASRRKSKANVSPTVASRFSRPQASRTRSKPPISAEVLQHPKWAALSTEDKSYLMYHRERLSHHHYAFKHDGNDFLKTTYLEIALNDATQALLYAIIAFSAYHRSIERADFDINIFLSYYNKSITCLHHSLTTKKPGIATLLTILQLATIEEFLGDWSKLFQHQKAAHQILTDLFQPSTIMQDETRRRIISWYIRFDLFAGMMSGSSPRLGREWFAACRDFYTQQAKDRPDDLGAQYDGYFSTSRLLATDVALLFAAKVANKISNEQFGATVQELLATFATFGRTIEDAFTEPNNYVKEFPHAPPPSPEDITNFRDPYFLRAGELFTMNFVLLDFWAIDLMFKYNLTKVHGTGPTVELREIALKTCKMFEAIQYSNEGPPGAVIGCQASLGIASLFLPKDERHSSWCRRKYATIEQAGYIYPPQLRQQLSEAWGVDVTGWWLPNDDGYPDIIRALREFIAYRTELPKGIEEQHLREMSGLFRSMNVDDQGSSPSSDSRQVSPIVPHESLLGLQRPQG